MFNPSTSLAFIQSGMILVTKNVLENMKCIFFGCQDFFFLVKHTHKKKSHPYEL